MKKKEISYRAGYTQQLADDLKQAEILIKDMSRFISDYKWYAMNNYDKASKELVRRAQVFLSKG